MTGVIEAQFEGVEAADVRAAAAKLWRCDPKFWKEWLKKPSRTAEERTLMGPHLDAEVES